MKDYRFDDLLYPGKDSKDRDERLGKLRRDLEDPEVRQALIDYLSAREKAEQQQRDDPDKAWTNARHPQEFSTSDEPDDLYELSTELAASLGARRDHSIPMPRNLWVPAFSGLLIGALLMWVGLSMIPSISRQIKDQPQFPTFEAAIENIIESTDNPEILAQLDLLLKYHEDLSSPSGIKVDEQLRRDFNSYIRSYQPGAMELRKARELVESQNDFKPFDSATNQEPDPTPSGAN